MARRLALFARHPAPGRVKTRLTPALTAPLASALYQAMLADALDTLRDTHADERFVYWAESEESLGTPFDVRGVTIRHQHGETLGDRLAAAFDELVVSHDDRAVVVGADCPGLIATMIESAFDSLGRADLVVGPSRDGGYVLIGLRRARPGVFSEVDWGTERVLEQTLERARRERLSFERLEPLEDVDTAGDLVELIRRGLRSPERLPPHTTAALREIGLLPAAAAG